MTDKIQEMVIIAMFAAIISIISIIPTGIYILGVPLTLQTFACFFAGYVLGSRDATKAIIIYIMLGLVGLPVFSGFNGGPGALFSVTGGYILGFIAIAAFSGIGIKYKSTIKIMLVSFIGLIICYIMGTSWFAFVSKNSIRTAFLIATLPYLPKDMLSMLAAYFIAKKVRKSLKFIKKDI